MHVKRAGGKIPHEVRKGCRRALYELRHNNCEDEGNSAKEHRHFPKSGCAFRKMTILKRADCRFCPLIQKLGPAA